MKNFDQRQRVKSMLDQQGIKSYYSHQPMFYFDAFKSFTGIPGYVETATDYFNCILHIPCRYDLLDSEVEMIAQYTKAALSC
jgi:dTDP-4-amino-4,6-dideoxygalactose transaminase